MKVTFHQLEVFACVARRLSFTRAAEELSLSQPTVSAQIRQLGEEIGLPLFEQIGKTVTLTEAGRELLAASDAVFDTWSRFEMTVSDLRGLKRGRLALACVTTAKYFFPAILGPFCKRHPEIDVRLEIANRESVVERLRANRDDAYIMTLPPRDLDVECIPFRENQLVVVAAADHRLVGRPRIPLARLKEDRFIQREAGSGTRLQAQEHFDARGFTPNVRMELGGNEAIKHAVAAGLGISVLSRQVLGAGAALEGLAVLDVAGFPLRGQWFLVYPRGKRHSVVAQAFHDFLCGEIAERRLPVESPAGRLRGKASRSIKISSIKIN